jgi:hypothetical protein
VPAANVGLREAPWGVRRGGRGSTLATHVVMECTVTRAADVVVIGGRPHMNMR